MGGFNASDKIVLAVLLYLVFFTSLRFVAILFGPSESTIEFGKLFAGFAEFVIGAVIGYVGGKSEDTL